MSWSRNPIGRERARVYYTVVWNEYSTCWLGRRRRHVRSSEPRCQLFYPGTEDYTAAPTEEVYIDWLIASWNDVIWSRIPMAQLGGVPVVEPQNSWFDYISLGPQAFVVGVEPPWEGLGVLLLSSNSRALTSLDVICAITENESYNPWEREDVGGTTYVNTKITIRCLCHGHGRTEMMFDMYG